MSRFLKEVGQMLDHKIAQGAAELGQAINSQADAYVPYGAGQQPLEVPEDDTVARVRKRPALVDESERLPCLGGELGHRDNVTAGESSRFILSNRLLGGSGDTLHGEQPRDFTLGFSGDFRDVLLRQAVRVA